MASVNLEPLQISVFSSEKDNTPRVESVEWAELCHEPIVSERKPGVLCWSPALFSGQRSKRNVSSVSCLVFDLDEALTDTLIKTIARYQHIVHSTFTAGRWRVILRTSRPHTAHEHKALWLAVSESLGGGFDTACTDASRIYYWPTKHPDRIFEKYEEFTGRVVDVDAFLLKAPTINSKTGAPFVVDAEDTPSIDLDKYRAQVRESKIGTRKPLATALLSGKWGPDPGSRDNTLLEAIGGLFTVADPIPSEAVCEFLAEGVLSHMNCEPEGRDSWRRVFLKMCERNRAFQLERRANAAAADALFEREAQARGDEADWRAQFQGKRDEAGRVETPAPTGFNINLILRNDSRFKTLRFNLVNRKVECSEGPLAGVPYDVLETRLANWLSSEYKMKASRPECKAQIDALLVDRQYDPLKEYLEAVGATWDGTERISSLLRERCGATTQSAWYVDAVSRKFFLSAVARGLRPGTQVDTMLILQGEGGVGKTSFIRSLGGPYSSEMTLNIHDKDALMAITGNWLVEQAEMSTMKKADEEGFRSFLTRTVDSFRPPYGRTLENYPRRCVFVGTSNEERMLGDVDGQRRYWPVRVGEVQWQWIANNRDQLWAEAVAAYKAGEVHYFENADDKRAVSIEVGLFQKTEPMAESIVDWFLTTPIAQRPTEVSGQQILQRALDLSGRDLIERRHQMACAKALKSIGFEKYRTGIAAGREYRYKTPEYLLTAAVTKRGGPLITAAPKAAEHE